MFGPSPAAPSMTKMCGSLVVAPSLLLILFPDASHAQMPLHVMTTKYDNPLTLTNWLDRPMFWMNLNQGRMCVTCLSFRKNWSCSFWNYKGEEQCGLPRYLIFSPFSDQHSLPSRGAFYRQLSKSMQMASTDHVLSVVLFHQSISIKQYYSKKKRRQRSVRLTMADKEHPHHMTGSW